MARAPLDSKARRNRQLAVQTDLSNVAIIVGPSAPIVSEAYSTYWKFAHERQAVYIRRVLGCPSPWTADAILLGYRFTNPYRAADRVSQYLIRNVIYAGSFSNDDIVFRILLFKFFNRIDTWELLERELGEIRWTSYKFRDYDRVLAKAIESGGRLYSGAYIMPACQLYGMGRKHRGHLRLIARMVKEGIAQKLINSASLAQAFAILRAYPMIGDFLAYQYVIDINYSELLQFREDDFVVPGPGARDGLRKVFYDPGEYCEADLIRWVSDRQELEFERRGISFQTLWGRRLQLIDCQNLFCEVDKYARVKHPELSGLTGRTRIKQKFNPAGKLPTPWFPPKWGLNEKVSGSVGPRNTSQAEGILDTQAALV